jgi:hypothetical protein
MTFPLSDSDVVASRFPLSWLGNGLKCEESEVPSPGWERARVMSIFFLPSYLPSFPSVSKAQKPLARMSNIPSCFDLLRRTSGKKGSLIVSWEILKSEYGNIASVIGTIFTLIGFTLTLWQI